MVASRPFSPLSQLPWDNGRDGKRDIRAPPGAAGPQQVAAEFPEVTQESGQSRDVAQGPQTRCMGHM